MPESHAELHQTTLSNSQPTSPAEHQKFDDVSLKVSHRDRKLRFSRRILQRFCTRWRYYSFALDRNDRMIGFASFRFSLAQACVGMYAVVSERVSRSPIWNGMAARICDLTYLSWSDRWLSELDMTRCFAQNPRHFEPVECLQALVLKSPLSIAELD